MPQVKTFIRINLVGLLGWLYFGCHDVLMLVRSPIKLGQRPGMTVVLTRTLNHNSSKQTLILFVVSVNITLWVDTFFRVPL